MGSYIDSPEWIKKGTLNPKNKNDDKCFQYAITVASNYQQIDNHPEEIYNITPYIKQYEWNDIDFPSHKKDWNKFKKNNNTVALNVLFFPYNTKQITPAYVSRDNSDRENQVIFLMITDVKKWHYTFVKRLSALLKRITSKHDGDFYCINCFYSFTAKNAFKKHENVCKVHDYCYVEMLDKDNNILKYNSGEKYVSVPFILYVYMECLLKNISTCRNDPNKSSTIKINEHTPSGYSLLTYCSFENTKNRLNYYSGHDCMTMLCKDLKEQAKRVIYYKKMIFLTDNKKL